MKNIVWLASYPKSGNTWIRAIVYSALFGQLTIHKLGEMIPNFAFFASQLNDGKFESAGQIRHFWEQAQSQLCQSAGNERVYLKHIMQQEFMMWVNFHPENIQKKLFI